MRIVHRIFHYSFSKFDMAPKKIPSQPKISKLIRERSPASSSADERPSKKLASTTASENESDNNKPKGSTANQQQDGTNSLNKIMEKNLASIFNPMKKKNETSSSELADSIQEKRTRLYEDITEFRFNKKRVRVLSDAKVIPTGSEGILYWMSRDQRVQGNLFLYDVVVKKRVRLRLII